MKKRELYRLRLSTDGTTIRVYREGYGKIGIVHKDRHIDHIKHMGWAGWLSIIPIPKYIIEESLDMLIPGGDKWEWS